MHNNVYADFPFNNIHFNIIFHNADIFYHFNKILNRSDNEIY